MQPAPQAPGPAGSSGPWRDRPRFRQDLIAETVEHSGARFIDVMAPEGGDVFRFYEVEYSLACGMDGERDVAGIVKWAQDELGLTPSPQEVRTVIAALGDLGFIESGESGSAAEPAPELAAAPETAGRAARPTPTPGIEIAAGAALGATGAPRAARPTPQPHDVALGEPGSTPPASSASDVSINLSDHITVGPDDVQEAVRASKVMPAVEAPADALEVIQDPPTAPASAFDAPTVARIPDPAMLAESTRRPPQFARSPEPARSQELAQSQDLPTADTIRAGKMPLRAPATPVKPPVELPAAPITVKVDKPMPPPQQRAGVSPLLLVVLILAFLGAAVFFAWKYVLERSTVDVDTSAAPVPAPVKPAPPPPPPPPPPTAKIALETPDPEDVKVTRQGVIEAVVAENTAVKETEVIAKLKGNKPLDAQVAAMTNDINRQQTLLDAATRRFDTAHASGNKAAEAAAQTEIAERHKLIEAKENARSAKSADFDTFLVHAPKSGTFVPSTKPSATVAADAVIGKIVREAIPVATFKLGSTHSFAANGSVEISIRKGEQRVTCTVADVTPDSVKVICPVDPELTEGTEVALQAPGEATAAPPEPPPLPSGAPAPGGTPGTAAPSAPAGGPTPGERPAPGGTPGGTAAPSAPAEAPPAPSGSAAPSGASGSGDKPPN
jgi:hypothetical protein